MAYIHVFPLAYRNTNILFSLANRFIELAASSQKRSYGRGKCTSCTVGIGIVNSSAAEPLILSVGIEE